MTRNDKSPIGAWLVGSRGSIATTVVSGAAAIAAGTAGAVGCVTELADFASAGLVPVDRLVFGGCDVVTTPLRKRAEQLASAGVIPAHIGAAVGEALDRAESEMITIAGPGTGVPQRVRADCLIKALADFQARTGCEQVVVVNVASTEPTPDSDPAYQSLEALETALDTRPDVLPPSSLAAYAAFRSGHPFVDFTPSVGARLPALDELARQANLPYAGNDGKTGETLVKSVLAPMFAYRGLDVRSWYSANILGGGDGATLSDSEACDTKIRSKASSLSKLLGYAPESTVRIDYVADMGDWKTAWNHVAFQGFLGVQMKLQFTWQGCDSALAAPLILDLVRLAAFAQQRGESGPLSEFGFFFKDPVGDGDDSRLSGQYDRLKAWVAGAPAPAGTAS
ncbi:inositol-3-phosphate synthase [Catenulispora rubra]|uniref:inositol-3-phosphate synthase n=1 Tax=Catenulispora rubra TaxID=280293 RepID=UPI00189220B0|nr:inositol-3-phosphate synthase [Catenulispora rubra]